MKTTKFTILHLSDIHLHDPEGSKFAGTDASVAKAFLEHDFSDDKIDLIAVTGDIFDGPYIGDKRAILGTGKAYGDFFFQKLTDILPNSARILFAYGNHDMKVRIDKEIDTPVKKGFFAWFRKKKNLIDFIINRPDHEEELKPLKDLFAKFLETYKPKNKPAITIRYEMALAYAAFIKKCIDEEKGPIRLLELEKMLFHNFDPWLSTTQDSNLLEGKPFSYGVHFWKENNIIVARINSSWQNISSEYLDGHLSCGREQVRQVEAKIKEIKNANPDKPIYVITLMHNAFNSLGYSDVHIPKDKSLPIALVISDFSDLILCGHEHGELPPSLMHFESYLLKTGGLMNNKSPRNSFSIINLDFEKRELKRLLYIYNQEKTAFEIADSLHENFGLFSKFELFPKKARDYFVDQSRDIEEYLEFFKAHGLEFQPDESLPADMAGIFNDLIKTSAYSKLFFNRKEGVLRKAYIADFAVKREVK